jgi:polyisoprenoid-binding protein YceI
MSTATTTAIPGYLAGTWDIDPVHSDVSFTVRHMMVSKVRGRFTTFSGEIVTGEEVTDSSVTASIDAASVDTGNAMRDNDLRSAHFFDVENHPEWTFRSTGVRADGDGLVVDGDLTIKGVTRAVPLAVEMNGVGPDGGGGTRAGFSATTTIDRNDFGVNVTLPLDGGGVVVSDNVQISLEIEAVLRRAAEAASPGSAG